MTLESSSLTSEKKEIIGRIGLNCTINLSSFGIINFMGDERIEFTRRVVTDPSGRVELTEETKVTPAQTDRVKTIIRSRSKKEALVDKNKLTFPPGVLRSLRVVLPEALSLGGEDEEVYKVNQQHKAEFTVKQACLQLIRANRDRPVISRKVAEELVHSNPTYQRQHEFGIPSDMEEGWLSDTETALLESWPTAEDIKVFLDETS